jgi:MFS family permease
METQKSSNAKIGIYLSAILMMGVIGVSSSLSTIGAHFPKLDQTAITNLISVPCLVVIPVTLIAGKLMEYIAKKALVITGIVLFILGGVLPAFLNDFTAILIMRGLFGVGIGLIQVLCSALVAENYDGAARDKVMGTMNSFQMLGCAGMSLIGGYLGSLGWNIVFFVHLLGIISLIAASVYIPYQKPLGKSITNTSAKPQVTITNACIGWIIFMFIFFIGGQIFSNSVSFLVTELHIGSAAEAGLTLTFFACGGFIMGFIFGKINATLRNVTMSFGFLMLAVSYLIMALSGNIIAIFLGALICGLAFSICMPCIMVGAANSVNAASVGMAIAITTCSQNLGMTLCPYVVNPVSKALSQAVRLNTNQMAIILGAVLIGAFGVIFLIRGIIQNNKENLNMGESKLA